MKKTFLWLLAPCLLAMSACNNDVKVAAATDKDSINKAQIATAVKADQNRQTALSSINAFNTHDVDATFKECTPDFIDYGNGSSKPMTLEPVKQFFKGFLQAFPDYKVSNIRCVADGEWAMLWGNCTGTWKNDFMKQKPNGKSFKFADVDIFRFNEEGKVIEHYNIIDFGKVFKEIGIKM